MRHDGVSRRPLPPPLRLTIRFSSSLPDLDIDISSPQQTTVLALKYLLRTRISSPCRLRLIHQGHLLPDASTLSAVLKPPLPAPSSPDNCYADASDNANASPLPPLTLSSSLGKGKNKGAGHFRIYVNCSIGDELSAQDLAAEQAAATLHPAAPGPAGHDTGHASTWLRPRPRGFDRLLQAGFTSSEISTLRTEFASIHTDHFTPDAMPSPDSLRSMEDAWIDSNAGQVPSAANPFEDFANMSYFDILVHGMMIGFFFPLGSLTWLLRQGLWSNKWQIFVGSGVVLSLTVGVVMGISGDHS